MDDTIVVQFLADARPTAGTVTIRMLLPDGTIKIDAYQVTASTINNFYSFAVIPPVEGYLLSCIVQLTSVNDGSVWCLMAAFKGSVQLPIISFPPVSGMLIVQGYVDQWSWLSWPNSPAIEAGTGAGRMRNISLTPAAGANWSAVATSQQRWEVLSVQARLTTSAAAGTRELFIMFMDRFGTTFLRVPTNFTQGPSLAYFYEFYDGAAHLQTYGTFITAPFPQGVMLDPEMSISSFVAAMDAGDTWASVNVLVREWMGVGHG